MASWLTNTLVVVLLVMLFITLIGVITIKYAERLNKDKDIIRELQKSNNHKQQLLDAYGIKEIVIERESDD